MSSGPEQRAKQKYFRDLHSIAPASERSEQVAQFTQLASCRRTCFDELLSTSFARWDLARWLSRRHVRGRAWDLFRALKAADCTEARERLRRISVYANKKSYPLANLHRLLQTEGVAFSCLFAGWAIPLLERSDENGTETPQNNGSGNGHHSAWLNATEWPAYVACRSDIIESHLRLVPGFVSTRFGHLVRDDRFNILDLIQSGNCGLKDAVDRFEHELGWKFSSFAQWRIRAAVQKWLSSNLLIRMTPHRMEVVLKADRAAQRFLAQFGREPDPEELAAALNSSEKVAESLQSSIRLLAPESLDRPVGEDQTVRMVDTLPSRNIAPDGDVIRSLRAHVLAGLSRRLTPRERMVIAMRFALDPYERVYTLNELGVQFALSSERVRQIEEKAIEKMRAGLRSDLSQWLLNGQELR